ncbi:MAG: DNA polymerase III subunit delta [Bacilli bacterium]|nr:DNA polymerase III subunit delta [Bacilli bacterium]
MVKCIYKKIKRCDMENVYLYKGKEELIIRNKIDSIVSSVKIPSFNKTIYDLEISLLSEAVNDCYTIPLMGKKKIVIIRNPHFLEKNNSNNNGIRSLINYLRKPNDDCILIIDATGIEIDEKSEVYLAIEKAGEVSDTKNLSDVEMKGWLKSQFIMKQILIDEDAINLFFEYIGYNLVRGKQEVDKLINYLGDKKTVSIKDIETVVTDYGETDIFSLTQAINDKDKALVHKKYRELIKNGYDQIQLLNLIYKMFKNLYQIKIMLAQGINKNEMASILGVSPGRYYYLSRDASKFDMETIEKTLYNITELDYRIKTGQIDKATGMDLLLFGM